MPDFSRYEIDAYLGELANSGADFEGFYPKIEVEEIVPTRELEDPTVIKSKARGTYGQNVHSEQNPGSIGLRISVKEQPAWVLAAAFAGDQSTLNVTGSTVSDEVITIHKHDRIYQFAQRNIDDQAAVTITGAGGTPTYTEDDDYEIVDYRMGLFKMLSGGGGGHTEGTDIEVDYTYKDVTGVTIQGEQVQSKKFRLLLDMKNRVSGKDASMLYHEVNLSAPDVFDLATEDFITITLEGDAITPTGKTAPYEFKMIETQA